MKFKFLSETLSSLLLLVSLGSSAGIITDTDRDSFIDESTGIEWIDFGINNNQSFNYVASQLGAGGEYEGWALATTDQVYEMWQNAFEGLDYRNVGINRREGDLGVLDGADVFGSKFTTIFDVMGHNTTRDLGTEDEHRVSFGFFQGTDGISFVHYSALADKGLAPSSLNDAVHLVDYQNYDNARASGSVSSSTLLVRSVINVPGPSTLGIFSLALAGLALRPKN
jgi:hypothetical protein